MAARHSLSRRYALAEMFLAGRSTKQRPFVYWMQHSTEALNFIDTADVYSRWVEGHVGGESETILGKWLKQNGKRDKVVLATKVGMDMGAGRKRFI